MQSKTLCTVRRLFLSIRCRGRSFAKYSTADIGLLWQSRAAVCYNNSKRSCDTWLMNDVQRHGVVLRSRVTIRDGSVHGGLGQTAKPAADPGHSFWWRVRQILSNCCISNSQSCLNQAECYRIWGFVIIWQQSVVRCKIATVQTGVFVRGETVSVSSDEKWRHCAQSPRYAGPGEQIHWNVADQWRWIAYFTVFTPSSYSLAYTWVVLPYYVVYIPIHVGRLKYRVQSSVMSKV